MLHAHLHIHFHLYFVNPMISHISTFPPIESNHDRKWCESIASKVSRAAELPYECRSFTNLLANVQRRDSKNDTKAQMAKAFEGMSAGEMEAAMSARKHGHLNPAQIQRRMTHRGKKDARIW